MRRRERRFQPFFVDDDGAIVDDNVKEDDVQSDDHRIESAEPQQFVDVQGAAKVRDYVRALPNNDPLKIGYVDIFILPPDMEELRRRLVNRGTDAPDVIERRLANAEGEIARADEYMFKVTNDDLGHAYKRLCDLIDALSGRM